jgi:cellulose synthase/poly-beta-1,6-N-acetylglucosamine synthase-like glycosyltransferase
MTAETIFITLSSLLAWTYLVYPAAVIAVARLQEKAGKNRAGTASGTNLPTVTVILSLYNEEKVIAKKMMSLLESDYPAGLIDFVIGSDGSTDRTDLLMTEMASADSRIRFVRSDQRRGKAAMLNDLAAMAAGEILIVTDANVIFTTGTVRKLAEPFADPRTGICDATPHPIIEINSGITRQENLYSRFETALKRAEGDLWGAMPGPYGGCYAVRRHLFPPLPENILVDDLYAGLSVLKQKFRLFNIREAIVYEDTQPDIFVQFRRRTRIAAGSFQNLFHFGPFPSRKISVNFAFVSHKILRWLTPFLMILLFMTTVILSGRSDFYFCLTAFQLIFIFLSALDLALDRQGKKVRYQRYVTQFLLMNAALAAGFVRAVRGIENGIWEPTKRV